VQDPIGYLQVFNGFFSGECSIAHQIKLRPFPAPSSIIRSTLVLLITDKPYHAWYAIGIFFKGHALSS
jgi:hypothetical protein